MADFEPLPEIPMDRTHILDQITGRFQSVKDGLPELVKNSKDHYSRLQVFEKDARQIVVLISPDLRRIGVLDFGGAREEDFEGWQTWSSRVAGRTQLSPDIEAGYGNGGKSFMVRGAVRDSYMCGCVDKHMTKMGFKNDEPNLRYRPGWFKDSRGNILRGFPINNESEGLSNELSAFGISLHELPTGALETFRRRRSFTIVLIDGVRDWEGRNLAAREALVRRVPNELMGHAQSALTIETCSVWVQRGANLLHQGILEYRYPEPYPGFDQPVTVPVPGKLENPDTGERVSTGPGLESERYLEIRTSRQNLRLSDKRALNVVRIRNTRNVVGNWSVADLVPSATAGFVFGILRVPALVGEHLTGAERQLLAETPLVKALRHWTEMQLAEVAKRIQQAQASRDTEEDRNATAETLQKLRDLMRQFLEAESETGTVVERPKREFGSLITKIELETPDATLTIPVGTTVPLDFHCYEEVDGQKLPVRAAHLVLEAEDPGLVELVGRGSLKAHRRGECRVALRTVDAKVRSNPITVTTVALARATLEPPAEPLKQGERRQVSITGYTEKDVPIIDSVYEVSVEELEIGRIGRKGVFTAGRFPGSATVRVKYKEDGVATCEISIGSERIERDRPDGPDIPLLMLCGQMAPGREDLPEGQRTQPPGPSYPTIIDYDPLWEDIVWINSESLEALRVRGSRSASGAMGIHTKTFYQFLALKCFDVLRRLKVRQDFEDEMATSLELLRALSQAEIETAGFLDAAYSVVGRLLEGEEQ